MANQTYGATQLQSREKSNLKVSLKPYDHFLMLAKQPKYFFIVLIEMKEDQLDSFLLTNLRYNCLDFFGHSLNYGVIYLLIFFPFKKIHLVYDNNQTSPFLNCLSCYNYFSMLQASPCFGNLGIREPQELKK